PASPVPPQPPAVPSGTDASFGAAGLGPVEPHRAQSRLSRSSVRIVGRSNGSVMNWVVRRDSKERVRGGTRGSPALVWDAAATSEEVEVYVGERARGSQELDSLFGRLGAGPRGGVCVEVGCGIGRMTPLLVERFDRVIAVDVSPAMLDAARAA